VKLQRKIYSEKSSANFVLGNRWLGAFHVKQSTDVDKFFHRCESLLLDKNQRFKIVIQTFKIYYKIYPQFIHIPNPLYLQRFLNINE